MTKRAFDLFGRLTIKEEDVTKGKAVYSTEPAPCCAESWIRVVTELKKQLSFQN